MKLTINGVAIDATKEDLEMALKEFDKGVWTIKYEALPEYYCLYKNGIRTTVIVWNRTLSFQENYSQLIYKIAKEMGMLVTKEEMLNDDIVKYFIYYDIDDNKFKTGEMYYFIHSVAIKQNFNKVIVDLLNNSPLMEEFR